MGHVRKLGRAGLTTSAIGMGCWAIGGQFTMGGLDDGWGEVDDAQSIRAIHLGLELGAALFDTSDAYGTGHSERVLGSALSGRRGQAIIATKFGFTYDENKRALTGTNVTPEYVEWANAQSLSRLGTDNRDLYQIHVGDLTNAEADAIGEALETLSEKGRIRAWAWSTGNVESAARMLKFPHFTAIQHGLNVLSDAPEHLALCERHDLASLNNSPLAMGLLSGKFSQNSQVPPGDVRGAGHSWVRDFADGKPRPEVLASIDAVRDLLTTGGRTLAQGALGWLLARSPNTLPIPGFKTEAQVRDNLGALVHGPLPPAVMGEIAAALHTAKAG